MRKKNTPIKWPDQSGISTIDYKALERRVFAKDPETGKFTIGGQEITLQIRELLREQAGYIITSNFFEILDATLLNESVELALMQSTNFEHVQFAKALRHWHTVLCKMLQSLAK